MRENDPLYWHEQMGMCFVTRYQDVQAVRRFFTDWMVFSDPPAHTRLRKLVSRAFVPRSIAMLESFTHRVVDEALDRVNGQDQIDIIGDLGFPMPSRVIAHMLGVAPDRVDDLEQWSHGITRILAIPDQAVSQLPRVQRVTTRAVHQIG
jgi:pimeloyl-[acyl-carrier protein] synthase